MERRSQISAMISSSTRTLLEKRARATGVKKGHLIEQALLHHLLALDELPAEFMIPPRVVVTRKSGEEILKRMVNPRPTKQLRDLLKSDGD